MMILLADIGTAVPATDGDAVTRLRVENHMTESIGVRVSVDSRVCFFQSVDGAKPHNAAAFLSQNIEY
jgi:hypothetical protein